jgi:predicted Zn finger-like uncharacterized protein
MLTKKLACPSCQAKLRVADELPVGKAIRCPKCSHSFPIPVDEEDESPPVVAVKRRKTAPPPEEQDELDEEEERRPIRRKRRKKAKKPARNTALIAGLAIGGAVLVIGVAVTLAVVFWNPKSNTPEPTVANNPSPPAGAQPEGRRGPRPGIGQMPGAGPGAGPEVAAGRGPTAGAGGSDQFAAGRKVFAANCSRCHNADGGRGRGRGPDLSHVGANPSHTIQWFKEFISDPNSKKPDARMPGFAGKISDKDLTALAEYLASLK